MFVKSLAILCFLTTFVVSETVNLFREDVVKIRHEKNDTVTVVINHMGDELTFHLEPNTGSFPPHLGHTVYPYKGVGDSSTDVRFTFDPDFDSWSGYFIKHGVFHYVHPPVAAKDHGEKVKRAIHDDAFLVVTVAEDHDHTEDAICAGVEVGDIYNETAHMEEIETLKQGETAKERAVVDLVTNRPGFASRQLPTSDCPGPNGMRELKVGVWADYSYVEAARKRSDIDDVRNYMVTDYNTIIAVYERTAAITYRMMEINVATGYGSPGESWNSRCGQSINSKLDQFTSWGQGLSAPKKDYGLWHLLTNCYPPPGTIGLAWVGVVCGRNRYGVSNLLRAAESFQVITHEMGHNWSCRHTSNGIMGASLKDNHWFEASSQTAMCNHAKQSGPSGCLGKPTNTPPPPPPPPPCEKKCGGKECGDDGCDSVCGVCGRGKDCVSGKCEEECDTTVACSGKQCGNNGCGGVCGICSQGQDCRGGKCVDPNACTPKCSGKECGDDTCSGVCGICGADEDCISGQCKPQCTPKCVARTCGSDGCGGVCGTCDPGVDCISGNCKTACTPKCVGKECGDDSCGGECGTCAKGENCVSNECKLECTPQCQDKNCGNDGCGSTCGVCDAGVDCLRGFCGGKCTPNCEGKQCGNDGCGGSCGTCKDQDCVGGVCRCIPQCINQECGDDGCGGECGECGGAGQCKEGICECEPLCRGKSCGDDGCGGLCDVCGQGEQCNANFQCECKATCEKYGITKQCGGDGCGGICGVGTCPNGELCEKGICTCQPKCASKECGDDGCGKGGVCGTCDINEVCTDGLCECIPSCQGKECGDFDGCGGSCGTCATGEICTKGVCECISDCEGKVCGDDGCGSACGFCSGGKACDLQSSQCVCVSDCANKNCGDDGCGGSCGTCDGSLVCNQGTCAASCTPNCDGKECGSDGCEGTCGNDCPSGEQCSNGKCECVPQCEGKQCGFDSCESFCGEACPVNYECKDNFCVVGCIPECEFKECGSDGCGRSCGSCADPNANCIKFKCVTPGAPPPPSINRPDAPQPLFGITWGQVMRLQPGQWAYDTVDVNPPNLQINFAMATPSDSVTIFAKYGGNPSETDFDFISTIDLDGNVNLEVIAVGRKRGATANIAVLSKSKSIFVPFTGLNGGGNLNNENGGKEVGSTDETGDLLSGSIMIYIGLALLIFLLVVVAYVMKKKKSSGGYEAPRW